MKEHEQRVIDEVMELKEKLQKLVNFMHGPIYPTLSVVNQGLLMTQQVAMCNYVNALDRRVELFEVNEKQISIQLSPAEIQSGVNRQSAAEGLILQLPKDHDGRNTWLLNYGTKEEAVMRRASKFLLFSQKYQCIIRSN